MIISPGRGYVFVHIPKTGGTAMTLALEARARADDILIGDTPKAIKRRRRLRDAQTVGRLWKHSTLKDVRGLLPDTVLDALVPVTMVRNPWDRTVSYYHWLRGQTFDHPAVDAARRLSFAEFVMDDTIGRSLSANTYYSYVAGVCDPIFIRLEALQTDLEPFEALLGFRIEMPHVNRSDRAAGWRDYYDDETRARVADISRADIEQFGYDF
ncbi:MAG: sulfotransferase family 2 domain-containing protein [Jannaschia sp.]